MLHKKREKSDNIPYFTLIDLEHKHLKGKGSFGAFSKIIIWCNRICRHALMFKKTLFF